MAIKKIGLAALAGAIMAASAHASDNIANGAYLAPGIHYQMYGGNIFDRGFSFEREGGLNLGLGYQWQSGWAIELAYHYTDTELEDTSVGTKTAYTHLDVLYHFGEFEDSRWSPYLVFGAGRQDYDLPGGKENDEQVNLGVGLKYAFTNNFFFRSDLRSTVGYDDTDAGGLFNMGLMFIFGGNETRRREDEERIRAAEARAAEEARRAQVAESKAAAVVAAVADSDGDGVPDDRDACSGTERGAKVDERGCYLPLKQPREFTLRVNFASGSSEVNAESRDGLRELSDFLREYPNTNVVIEGHSDSSGNAASNKRLSQQRADSVKYALINNYNIEANRVNSIGWGIEKPIADNSSAEGRAKNRRVVARVSDK